MELSTLRFIVETKDLEEAAKKIDALGVSVSKLNKPMQAMSTESAKANKELSKAEEAAAKAALAQTKLEQAQNKGAQAASKSTSVLERQNLILEYMAQGNSKGQASILATAKAAGALDEDMLALNKTLVTQRTLIGGDPFDKSIGLMQKLQNEYKITTEVTTLFNKNLGLTQKQMIDLAREKERLIALYAIEGKDIKGLTAEYDQLIQKSKEINTANDARNNGMKSQIKAQADAAKANAYLADVDARLAAALDVTNKSLDKQSTDALVKYQKALKTAGLSADEAATKLAAAKTQFEQIADKKQADKLQYLARAISVQMGDVGISLASGMNPLLVMIQQGDQIRGAIQQAGAEGKDLEEAMAGAATQIATSFIQTGQAIGGFFVNAIKSAGTGAVDFFLKVTRINNVLENMRYQIALAEGSSGLAMKTFLGLGTAIRFLAGVIVVGAVAGLIAYGVALKQVIAEESALSKAINLTGASLGLTTNSALALSEELAGSKGNIGSYVTAITDIAKAGGITSDNLKTVATTIVEVSKITGISSETLAKNFSKIAEKPLEALIPFAKELGTINVETLKQIQNLIKAGKETEAVKLATDEYAKALKGVSATIKEDMGAIETIFYGVGSAAKSMWNEILNIGRKGTLENQMKDAVASLIEAQKGKSWYSRFGRTNEEEVKYYEEIVQSLGRQINAQKELGDVKAKNAADVTKFEKNFKGENKESDRLKKSFEDSLEAANKFYQTQIGAVNELTKSEIALNKVKEESDYKKFSPEQKKQIDAIYEQASANEKLVKAEKDRTDQMNAIAAVMGKSDGFGKQYYDTLKLLDEAWSDGNISLEKHTELVNRLYHTTPQVKARQDAIEKLMQAQKKSDDALFDSLDVEHQLNMQILEQTDLLALEGSLIGATEAERKKSLATKRLDLQLEKEIIAIKNRPISAAEQEAQIAQARQRRLDAEKNVNTEIANDAAAKTLEEYNKIKDGVTDSIVTALIEGGESGGKKLRDIIEAELRKPITIIVRAAVDMLMGNSGSSSVKSAMNIFSTGASVFSLGSQVAAGTMSLANAGGSLFANATGGGLDALLATNAAYGTAASAGGATAAGAAANAATAGSAGFGSSLAAAGPYVLAALAVANALGLFRSTKQVGGGISGTLGGTGSVDQYGLMRKSGTLFNGPSYFRQNQGTFAGNEALQQTFDQLKTSTKMMADTLKLSSAGVEDFTKVIDISFDGLTDAQRQEKLASVFQSVNDELAALVLGAGATAEQLSTLYNNVMQQRYDLETQLLELQGKTLELRERERAKIYDVNKGLFDQIKALEDQKAANEAAAVAMEKLTSVTTTIVDEINRLRGVSQTSSGLESQFAILTAQARSGDLTALAQLPEVTKGLEQIAASSAVNATDIIFARARLAQSLQDTLGYFPAGTLSTATTSVATLPSVATASAGASVSSASSNQELLAALVIEVQGLRAEVRADVSHNAKTAKILERVNQDGESLTVTTLV